MTAPPSLRRLDPPPFFIVGCWRSGSTLFQALLDAHPNIAIPPTSAVFSRFRTVLDSYGDLRVGANRRAFVRALLTDRYIRMWGDLTVEEVCARIQDHSVRGVLIALFESYAARQGKSRWGDKTLIHVYYLREIKAVFPEAKIVHLIRDGRDMSVSLRRQPFGPKAVDSLARKWTKNIMAFQQAKAWLRPEDVLEVRYEELVRDPEAVRNRVFAFLGEDPDPLREKRVPDTKLKDVYVRHGRHHQGIATPISTRKIGGFKTAFTPREIEIFESYAGDALTLYGYPLSSSGQLRPTGLESLRMRVTDYLLRSWLRMLHPHRVLHDLQRITRIMFRSMVISPSRSRLV